jgi:hypothetical protein
MKITTLAKIALITAQLLGSAGSYASPISSETATNLINECASLNNQWANCYQKDSSLGAKLGKLSAVCDALADYEDSITPQGIDDEFALPLTHAKVSMRNVLGQIASVFDKQISDAKTYRDLIKVVRDASQGLLSNPLLTEECAEKKVTHTTQIVHTTHTIDLTLMGKLAIGAVTAVGAYLAWLHHRGQIKRGAAVATAKGVEFASQTTDQPQPSNQETPPRAILQDVGNTARALFADNCDDSGFGDDRNERPATPVAAAVNVMRNVVRGLAKAERDTILDALSTPDRLRATTVAQRTNPRNRK